MHWEKKLQNQKLSKIVESYNRDCFFSFSLLEIGIDSVASRVKEDLKSISTSERNDRTNKGLDILMKLMSA